MGNKKCHSVPAYVHRINNKPSIDDFKQDSFGSDDNNSQTSDKENGNKDKNKNINTNLDLKGAGSKRKLSSMFLNEDDSKKTQRPSSAKKSKR